MSHYQPVEPRHRRKITAADHQALLWRAVLDFLIGLGIVAAILGFASFDSRAVKAAVNVKQSLPAGRITAAQAKLLVTPEKEDMPAGAVLLNSRIAGKYVKAPRLGTDIKIAINGLLAHTTITQRYFNPLKAPVKGLFTFALPEEGQIISYHLKRSIVGSAMSSASSSLPAQQLKDGASEHRFTATIPRLAPRETFEVQFAYQQPVTAVNRRFQLVIPLTNQLPRKALRSIKLASARHKTTARPSGKSSRHAFTQKHPLRIRVQLNPGMTIEKVEAIPHGVTVTRIDERNYELEYRAKTVPQSGFFALDWTFKPASPPSPSLTLFRETVEDSHYFYGILSPQVNTPPQLRPPNSQAKSAPKKRTVIFVLDHSKDMTGSKLTATATTLIAALSRLTARERFNLIFFDGRQVEAVFRKPVIANARTIAAARYRLLALRTSPSPLDQDQGASALEALKSALQQTDGGSEKASDQLRQVLYITGGTVANKAPLFTQIIEVMGRTRLFTVAIGAKAEPHFLRRLAEIGRGHFTPIADSTRIAATLSALLERLASPAITDLSITWPSGVYVESFPNPLPDLYAGMPLTFIAKTSSLKGEIQITGQSNGNPWSAKLRLIEAQPVKQLSKFWARQKIESLQARRYVGTDEGELEKSLADIARALGVAVKRNRLIPIDRKNPNNTQARFPPSLSALPAKQPGSHDNALSHSDIFLAPKAFKPTRRHRQAFKLIHPLPQQPQSKKATGFGNGRKSSEKLPGSPPTPEKPPTAATQPQSFVSLNPQKTVSGQTADEVTSWSPQLSQSMIGVVAVLFSAMFALTFWLWRSFRHAIDTPRRIRKRR